MAKVIPIYRRKRDAMLVALDQRCAKFWRRRDLPEGGFFLWAELAEGVDSECLYHAALQEGVRYFGGRAFLRLR